MRLKEKVAIVTGAGSRGIGRSIALSFIREGARVAIVGRTLSKLEEAAREMEKAGGGSVLFTSSGAGLVGSPSSPPYSAAKVV